MADPKPQDAKKLDAPATENKVCPKCQLPNSPAAKFCGGCGSNIEKKRPDGPPPVFKHFDTAKYTVNNPNGCYIGRRMVPQDEEITVPYHTEPRNSWIPRDEAAHQRFAEFNYKLMAGQLDHIEQEIGKKLQNQKFKGETDEEIEKEVVKFRKKHLRRPLPQLSGGAVRPTDEIASLQAQLAAALKLDAEVVKSRVADENLARQLTGSGGTVRASDS